MKRIFLAMGTALAALGVAGAQTGAVGISSEIRNPSAPVTSLHAEALIPIVSQMGLSYEGATLPSGERVLLVETPGGRRMQLTPMACDRAGVCRGYHMSALFAGRIDRRTAAAFNDRYAFVTAGLSGEDAAFLSRYELADYGLPRGNIAVSIEMFLQSAVLFEEHLANAPRHLQQAPEGSDLAAHGLNLRGLVRARQIPGPSLGHSPAAHTLGFEDTSRIVATFVRAEKVYPGRIVNTVD